MKRFQVSKETKRAFVLQERMAELRKDIGEFNGGEGGAVQKEQKPDVRSDDKSD